MNPRYRTDKINGIPVVMDLKTELIWERAISKRAMTWDKAKAHAASLGPGWRLPTVEDFESLAGSDLDGKWRDKVFLSFGEFGEPTSDFKKTYKYHVRCVRDLTEPTEGREFWEAAEWGAADPDYNQRRESMFRELYRKTFPDGLVCPLCHARNWKIMYVSPYVGMRCEKCKGIQLFDALRAE